jgi:hypothetical protein
MNLFDHNLMCHESLQTENPKTQEKLSIFMLRLEEV